MSDKDLASRCRPGEITLGRVRRAPVSMETDRLASSEEPVDRAGHRPPWLRTRLPQGEAYERVGEIIQRYKLHTVCQSAHCLNMGECWTAGTATFMILGDVCTRSCGFCAVRTGRPEPGLDLDEPRRIAEAVRLLGLRHAVVTSVNRDEREDGGAPIFAETIRLIRVFQSGCTVEVLIPDFRGIRPALDLVFEARPDLLDHNLETVPRLYRRVRPQARYERSLEVLQLAKQAGLRTKTSIMVGLGEREEEVASLMDDLVAVGLDVMTIGQYLRPTRLHLPVVSFIPPEVFERYRALGESKGIEHVESGPLVRTSYHAERHVASSALHDRGDDPPSATGM